MLSEEELREIEEELKNVPTKEAGSIDALKVIQRHRGYVSDEAVEALAPVLGMTAAELDRVASFYNLIFRQPVGRHIILVCDSISCFLTGQETVMSYLIAKLGIRHGQTTDDGMFTLLPTVCLGHCEQSPVMMLDWQIIGNLTLEKIDQAINDVLSREELPDSGTGAD